MTAFFDGIVYGTAGVSWDPYPDQAGATLRTNDMSLSEHRDIWRSHSAYVAEAANLLEDEAQRLRRGDLLSAAARDSHAGDGWLRYLSDLYVQVREEWQKDPARETAAQIPAVDATDMLLWDALWARGETPIGGLLVRCRFLSRVRQRRYVWMWGGSGKQRIRTILPPLALDMYRKLRGVGNGRAPREVRQVSTGRS